MVLSTTRQVRYLRNLSAGIRANVEAASSRGERPPAAAKRAREDHTLEEDKPALQRRKEAVHPRPSGLLPKCRSDKVSKDEITESEEKIDEDTEEEEVVEYKHRPLGGAGDRKPPEPKGPPPAWRPPVANQSGQQDRHRHSGSDLNANIVEIEDRINTNPSIEQDASIRGLAGWNAIQRGPSIAS